MSDGTVSWNYIAARQEHIIAPNVYQDLFGAPDPLLDSVAYYGWMRDMQDAGWVKLDPIYHTEDCPGCWAEQWRE